MSNFWTSETIENYKQASEYSSFHKKLAVLAEPYLDRQWTMADLGCGPGLLSLQLSPMVGKITAIDDDELAISDLQARLDDVFLTNEVTANQIQPVFGDIRDLKDEKWDIVMASFIGLDRPLLDDILPRANKLALIYTRGRKDAQDHASLSEGGESEKLGVNEIEAYLEENHYAYKKSVHEMQFGQPFKSIEDIHGFLEEKYAEEGQDKDEAVKRIAAAEERIVKSGRFDYPYYLPKSISVALFIIVMNEEN